MVIVRANGTIILEEGDPNYVDLLQAGPDSPQNELLDQDPDAPLSTFILDEFAESYRAEDQYGAIRQGLPTASQS